MNLSEILNIVTAVATLAAVIGAFVAIYYSNKNSKQQILVYKLEEIFQVISELGKYHSIFMRLQHSVLALRDPDNDSIQTLQQYYDERSKHLTEAERTEVIKYLSRVEVLAECYTKGRLKTDLIEYYRMMSVFFEFVYMGASIGYEIKYKDGFPNYDEYSDLVAKLKKDIVSQTKLK